ncbi:MAG: hypothetical protein IJW02_01710 [Clostridia bacterium]|nr:hypothetical protein [Clostridia bacterium]
MNNGFNNDYEARLLGDGSEEELDEFEPEKAASNESEEYYELPLAIKSRSLIWSVISFAAGILSLALCPFYYVGFVFAVGAVITALISRHNLGFFEKYSIMGIVLGIMGFVFSAFSLIAGMIGLFN